VLAFAAQSGPRITPKGGVSFYANGYDKPGYQTVMGSDASQAGEMIFGNLIFGGVIGMIVDLATGADYEYGSSIFVTFSRDCPPVAQMLPSRGAPGV